MTEQPILPGGTLTEREFTQVVDVLSETPVSFFICVDVFGRIISFPPFQPNPMTPDMPTLFRQLADKMEVVK